MIMICEICCMALGAWFFFFKLLSHLAVKYVIPLLFFPPCRCSLDWFLDNKEHDGQASIDRFRVVTGKGEVLEAAEDGVSDDWSGEAMDARCDDALLFENSAFFGF
mmetsp:Transcript_24835/g.40440  ORF Transcript_24835/g.40440 Transcript_24835/m.40440 type:complete len:106 (+) Transcript_24835:30-347(+)|eukprot:CAMPEP_0196181382 /NCGR_PEP_ID=MMETSP0911-20130528/26729_1 /TAXON_ID=49265 /ORGANISM="Thalassiosira rotula, Strain GSO102" /LENGTH=105 /DNA_ID=CAMNT_0041450773 /DNA_START=17 /DNA_END=334 /DNA_ORIENTATION=+